MESYTFEITALAHGGHGVGRIDGQVCFVPCTVPGDVVRVRNLRRNKGVLWALVEAVEKPSAARRAPVCPYFGLCGGCTWLHIAPDMQAEWKQRIVRETLRRIGGFEVEPTYVYDERLAFGYRTRATFHGDGTQWGFHAADSRDIVPIDACPLCHPKLNEAYATLRQAKRAGHVTITVNPEGDDVLVWWRGRDQRGTNDGFVFDGTPISAKGFSQSSLLLNRLLRAEVHRMIGDARSLLDLYCGSGNLSITLGDSVETQGIDHSKDAIAAANALRSMTYRFGNEMDFVKAIKGRAWDAILLDPPRTGAKTIVPALTGARANAIIYVACDPASLARDGKTLLSAGWRVDDAVVIDMFPNTWHAETVCRFVRR